MRPARSPLRSQPGRPGHHAVRIRIRRDVLLDFNPPPPPNFESRTRSIDVVNLHSVMLDPAKMTTGGRVTVQPFYNTTLGNTLTYAADGIRVDYPNEIVFYVERKNDVTTNYYNFVGLDGTVPDGVSIEVIDPFRVFDDEGRRSHARADRPRRAARRRQKCRTTGTAKKPDGSQANVLLVGGYWLEHAQRRHDGVRQLRSRRAHRPGQVRTSATSPATKQPLSHMLTAASTPR